MSRLSTNWKPILIEKDADVIACAQLPDDIETVVGDATSTLVLRRAGFEDIQCAVATTSDDEVNLEFCRLMKDMFQVRQLVALVQEETSLEQFRALEITTISRLDSLASVVDGTLDSGRRTTSDIGLGIGEICEVTVQSHSPVIGRTLSNLRPQSWILGAIYRDGKLVVPHGKTEIRAGDKCLLIGDPAILEGISDYFQRGSSEFPLQFGSRLCLLEQPAGRFPDLKECDWILSHTEAQGLGVFCHGMGLPPFIQEFFQDRVDLVSSELTAQWPSNLLEQTDSLDCGVVLLAAPQVTWKDKVGLGNQDLFAALDRSSEPFLISRGSYPYKKILLAVSPSPGSLRAGELAVDVARKFEAELTVMGVLPPDFVVGTEYEERMQRALEATRSRANLYSRRVEVKVIRGNPVHQVLRNSEDFDLLIVAHRRGRRFSLIQQDVSRHLVARTSCSVLVLPFSKDDLNAGS